MRSLLLPGVLFAVLMVCGADRTWADWPGTWVGYDPQTTEYPSASWTLAGAGTEFITSVSDGIAYITTTTPNKGQRQRVTGFDGVTGFTVDIRTRELQNDSDKAGVGFRIIANNVDGDGWAFIFKFHGRADADNTKGRVTIAWSDGPNHFSSSYPDTNNWHVFRVAAKDNNVKIYVDDIDTPIYDRAVELADRGNDGIISFGDWGTSVIGDAELDYIIWNDTQAFFAPPLPVPSDGTLVLVR